MKEISFFEMILKRSNRYIILNKIKQALIKQIQKRNNFWKNFMQNVINQQKRKYKRWISYEPT